MNAKKERSRSRDKDKKKSKKREREPKETVADKRIDPKTDEKEEEKPKILESDLIPALREDVSFLAQKYNEEKRVEKDTAKEENKELNELRRRRPEVLGRSGGVYVPPHKLAQLQQEILESNQGGGVDHQKLMWELLRKSINGIINKVNITNIQYVLVELLNENILRGKGLLARAIIKAQMASPNFTHVYAALICVINTKLPEIANLIIRRVILQFQRAYKRNNKIVCMATTRMIGHLINQQVLSDFLGLQLLTLLLEKPTEDSVEIACDFMVECGQMLSELTPAGSNAIFERFKAILHEGEIDRKVQYSIEKLFAIRKTKFKDHPGVIPELDLVEEGDKITHNISLDDEINGEEMLNIFKFDPFYEKTEEEWNAIKHEILGEENILQLKTVRKPNEQQEEEEEEEEENKIEDFTERDLVNLRRTIYLVIMNSLDFEECAHKLLKMRLGEGHEDEVCNMLLECCMHERTYLTFYGLLAQRFAQLSEVYKIHFMNAFVEKYTTIHRYPTSELRNIARMFAHLLFTEAIEWRVLQVITLTQERTTSSSRIFIKILFQELAEHMGLEKLNKRLQEPEMAEFIKGLFPKDHPKNTRFSINYFTSIGLGALTEDARNYLEKLSQVLLAQAQGGEQEEEEESSSDSDSDDESSSEEEDDNEEEQEKEDSRRRGNRERERGREREKEREREREKARRRDSSSSSSRGRPSKRENERSDRRRGDDHDRRRRKRSHDRKRSPSRSASKSESRSSSKDRRRRRH